MRPSALPPTPTAKDVAPAINRTPSEGDVGTDHAGVFGALVDALAAAPEKAATVGAQGAGAPAPMPAGPKAPTPRGVAAPAAAPAAAPPQEAGATSARGASGGPVPPGVPLAPSVPPSVLLAGPSATGSDASAASGQAVSGDKTKDTKGQPAGRTTHDSAAQPQVSTAAPLPLPPPQVPFAPVLPAPTPPAGPGAAGSGTGALGAIAERPPAGTGPAHGAPAAAHTPASSGGPEGAAGGMPAEGALAAASVSVPVAPAAGGMPQKLPEVRAADMGNAAIRPPLPGPPAPQLPAAPAAQIGAALAATTAAPDGTRILRLDLNPATLGRVQITVTQPPAAPPHVVVAVEKTDTLAALTRDGAGLQHALDQAGVAADGRVVTLHAGLGEALRPPAAVQGAVAPLRQPDLAADAGGAQGNGAGHGGTPQGGGRGHGTGGRAAAGAISAAGAAPFAAAWRAGPGASSGGVDITA